VPGPDGIDWETAFDRAYQGAYGVLRNAALAEDVAQDACIKALARLDSFRGRGSFAGWVRKIAHNLALDALRARRPIDPDPDPDDFPGGDDPEAGAFSREACDALHRCLGELTDHQREIFLGKYLDGMKGSEVAAEVDVQIGTVWATLHQSTANLRSCLSRFGIDRGALQ
jgi:RNA polymerase sigma-70 factor (ECF subfamily)